MYVSVLPAGAHKCTPSLISLVLSGDFSVFVRLTKTEKLSLEDQFSKKIVMCMFLCYQQELISVYLQLFPTTVVLSGDFSVFVRLTKTGKLSLEDQFSKK